MRKQEARNIAIKYLASAEGQVFNSLHKIAIDDMGTMSKDGYEGKDYDKIEKEVSWLIDKLYKYYKPKTDTLKL